MEDVTNLGKRRSSSNLQDYEKRSKTVYFTLQELEEAGEQWYPELVTTSCTNEDGNNVLACSRRDFHNHPPLGLVSRVQIIVDQDGKYDFQVVMFSKEKGSINTVDDHLELCDQIAVKGGFRFCPGINPDSYKTTYVTLHEKTKHIALKMIFELRRPLPTATFELVFQQI